MQAITHEELPCICSPCLGGHETRLVLDSSGSECEICLQPFVTYHWKPNKDTRRRVTLICRPCAESRKVCQSCIKDIDLHIEIPIREAALRILAEEGGTPADETAVLQAVADHFRTPTVSLETSANKTNNATIRTIIERLPLPGEREGNINTLCVYGIEEDFDIAALRSFFKSSIEQVEVSPKGRYAFFTFTEAPNVPESAVIDGRRLIFARGKRVNVPAKMQPQVGAIVRAYLQATAKSQ